MAINALLDQFCPLPRRGWDALAGKRQDAGASANHPILRAWPQIKLLGRRRCTGLTVAELGARNVKELWLTPYTSAGTKRDHTGQCVCSLAQLLEHNPSLFPMLRKWEPAEEIMNEPPPQSDVSS